MCTERRPQSGTDELFLLSSFFSCSVSFVLPGHSLKISLSWFRPSAAAFRGAHSLKAEGEGGEPPQRPPARRRPCRRRVSQRLPGATVPHRPPESRRCLAKKTAFEPDCSRWTATITFGVLLLSWWQRLATKTEETKQKERGRK